MLVLDYSDTDRSGVAAEPRSVEAGLAGKIPSNKLIGRKIVCISNLKPARPRKHSHVASGIGRYIREGDDETVELLDVPDSEPNSEFIYFEYMPPCEPGAMPKSKGSLKDWD